MLRSFSKLSLVLFISIIPGAWATIIEVTEWSEVLPQENIFDNRQPAKVTKEKSRFCPSDDHLLKTSITSKGIKKAGTILKTQHSKFDMLKRCFGREVSLSKNPI